MGNEARIAVGTKGAKQAASDLDQLRDRFTALQKQGAKGFALGAGAAVAVTAFGFMEKAAGGVVDAIGGSIQAASDLNETIQKSGVVFGSSEPDIEKWGKTAATSMGLSEDAAISAAASIGNLLRSTGTAPSKVAPMSKSIVQLASDLASFNNISVEDALTKLQSGLVGQERPLRELGVAISAASVDTEAAALGFTKLNGTFTEGEKVQARYSLIFKQTTTAQGDFARTSDQVANQQRILKAEMEDEAAVIGTKLIPAVNALQKAFLGVLSLSDPHTAQTGAITDSIANEIVAGNKKGLEQSREAIKKGIGDIHFWQTILGAGQGQDELAGLEKDLGRIDAALNATSSSMDTQAGKMKDDLVGLATSGFDNQTGKMADDFAGISGAAERTSSSFDTQAGKMKDDLVGISKAVRKTSYDFEEAARRIQASSQKTVDKLAGDASDLVDKAFDPQINHYRLVAAEAETSAARKAAAAKGASAAEQQAVLEAEKAEAGFLIAAAQAGDTNSQAYKKGVANLKEEIKNATGPTKLYLQGVLDKLHAIDSLDPNVTIRVNAAISKQAAAFGVKGGVIQDFGSLSGGHRAAGGPVRAGETYTVGEKGPETLVMGGGSGTILPHGATGTVGGSVNLTVNVHAAVGMTPAAARDIGNAVGPVIVDYLKRSGHLPRGAMPMHA